MNRIAFAIAVLILPFQSGAQTSRDTSKVVPAALKKLVSQQESMLTFESADLNGDGLEDFIFVVEARPAGTKKDEEDEGKRTLKIALRHPDNSVKVVKTNDSVVYCAQCGGVFGDPFEALEASTKGFTVRHYGGSNWRWANTYTFGYSRKDATWQLVEATELSFHTSDPNKQKSKTYRPPKHFGKIDIADFNPEKFVGVGKK